MGSLDDLMKRARDGEDVTELLKERNRVLGEAVTADEMLKGRQATMGEVAEMVAATPTLLKAERSRPLTYADGWRDARAEMRAALQGIARKLPELSPTDPFRAEVEAERSLLANLIGMLEPR